MKLGSHLQLKLCRVNVLTIRPSRDRDMALALVIYTFRLRSEDTMLYHDRVHNDGRPLDVVMPPILLQSIEIALSTEKSNVLSIVLFC
jgi:hypothetical protein